MTSNLESFLSRWFDGLNRGDLDGLLSLFSPAGSRIRNAARPPLEGPDAARKLLEDFFSRSCSRRFQLLDWAQVEDVVFASWTGSLTFAPGVDVGHVRLSRPLTVRLRGTDRFRLDSDGKIVECDIFHETTSPLLAARNAEQAPEGRRFVTEGDLRDLAFRYFKAEEEGDVDVVVRMCDPRVVVRNAAQTPETGLDGVRRYVSDFQARTSARRFTVRSVAVRGDVIFAHWDALLTFRAGVKFGPVSTRRPFSLEISGACRFVVNEEGKLLEIDVHHETTTVLRLAREAS